MTAEEILGARLEHQRLLDPAPAKRAAGELLGFQAQFFSYALHALYLRSGTEDTTGLIKTWTLRGTLHLIPEEDLPLYIPRQGAPEDVTETGWYRFLQTHDAPLPPDRAKFFAATLMEQIDQGVAEREALRERCRLLGMTEDEERHIFHPWGGMIAELAQLGLVAFTPSQKKLYRLCAPFSPLSPGDACTEKARRYLSAYGPATLRDMAAFFGVPQREAALWLAGLPVREDGPWLSLAGASARGSEAPACLFLSGFDPMLLGYKKEDNPLLNPAHLRDVYTLTGIVRPTVLLRGRLVATWKRQGRSVLILPWEAFSGADWQTMQESALTIWPRDRILLQG